MVPSVSVEEEGGYHDEAAREVFWHIVGDGAVVGVGVHCIIGRKVDVLRMPSFEVGNSFCG